MTWEAFFGASGAPGGKDTGAAPLHVESGVCVRGAMSCYAVTWGRSWGCERCWVRWCSIRQGAGNIISIGVARDHANGVPFPQGTRCGLCWMLGFTCPCSTLAARTSALFCFDLFRSMPPPEFSTMRLSFADRTIVELAALLEDGLLIPQHPRSDVMHPGTTQSSQQDIAQPGAMRNVETTCYFV